MLLYATLTSVWEAAHRPFWFDEVFTVVLTEMPSFRQVVAALRDAADTSGPGYYVVQHLFGRLALDPHVSYRLSSVFATSLICLVVFTFARRDVGPTSAMAAVFVVLASQLYHGYSVEARPYALMTLGVALAALAWQRADSWRWTIVMIASLIGAVAVHYYAVFVLMPFGAAEAARCVRTRQIRWGVWLALMGGGLTLLLMWPLLSALRSYYGANYWSTPSIGKALITYDTLSGLGGGGGLGLALALGLALLALLARAVSRHSSSTATWPPPESLVLVLGLLGLPVIVVSITWLMGGGYTDRYAIGVIPGLALGGAYVSGALEPRHRSWLLAFMVCAFGARELAFWGSGGTAVGLRQGPAMNAQPDLLAKATALALPMMVASGLDYVPLAYYTRQMSIDLVGVTDHVAALRHVGTDSIERDLVVLSRYMPLRVESFETFSAAHPVFLLLARPSPFSWWTTELLERGHTLTVVHTSGVFTLFKVERVFPAPPPQ